MTIKSALVALFFMRSVERFSAQQSQERPMQSAKIPSSNRIASLEALRGVASLIVVVWHTILSFAPERTGLFPQFSTADAWSGSPLFVLMNGNGAVNVFFVLSGFVLCRRFFLTGEPSSIVDNAIKRYPRLMMPVLLSVLCSYCLFKFGLYRFEEVAKLTGSPWLARFGNAYETPFAPSLWNALKQGVFLTFVRGDSYYNSSLWTMKYEFYASFFIFGGAFLLVASQRVNKIYPFYLATVMALMAWFASPWYFAFAAGMALAFFIPAGGFARVNTLPRMARAGVFLFSLLCLGFQQPVGIYQALNGANPVAINCLGSALLIALLLSVKDEGRWTPLCNALGALSFPLYLVHIPIIFSVVCGITLTLGSVATVPLMFIIVLSLCLCVIASLPLMWINEWWLSWLNTSVKRLGSQSAHGDDR